MADPIANLVVLVVSVALVVPSVFYRQLSFPNNPLPAPQILGSFGGGSALLTSRWLWDKRLVVPGLTGPKSLCVRLETQEIYIFPSG